MTPQRIFDHLNASEKIALARRMLLADGGDDAPIARLRAFVRWRKEGASEPQAVRSFLEERLPAHMIPAEIESVREWPRLPNGKVDRTALLFAPARTPASAITDTAKESPIDPRMRTLREIWQSLLARESIGVNEDFFAIGGHSLLAMQLISRLRRTFGLDIPLHVFFEGPTIAKLARALETQELLRPAASSGAVPTGEREQGVI